MILHIKYRCHCGIVEYKTNKITIEDINNKVYFGCAKCGQHCDILEAKTDRKLKIKSILNKMDKNNLRFINIPHLD